MNSICNKVNLIGNLGTNPEVRTFDNNKKKVSFSLATTEYYKDKSGERTEQTTWHNIICWNTMADLSEKLLQKGHKIALEGKLNSRSYEDKDGNKRYITEVVMQEMMLLTKKS